MSRRPSCVVVSVVGVKTEPRQHLIVNPLYVIDAAEVASSDEAVDRALRQFAGEWPGYAVHSSTKEVIGQANPSKTGSREDAQNPSRRQSGRQLEESHGQG